MKPLRLALFCFLPLALRAAAPEPIALSATLVTPHDIVLTWKDPAAGAAGHTVEWTMNPEHAYTILEFLPPGQTTYKHPDLMADTTCYYRVRAYYGPTSPEVTVHLPKDLTDQAYTAAFAKPENYQWAGPKALPQDPALTKHTIRASQADPAAGPDHFQIALMPITVSGFKLTWQDRAADAEGQMVEVKPAGAAEFRVRALVEPGINSFGWAFAPPHREATLRVRPYYYGDSSNVVELTTGPEAPAATAMAGK